MNIIAIGNGFNLEHDFPMKSSENELEIIRCHHLLTEIKMNEYFEMRAEEFEMMGYDETQNL